MYYSLQLCNALQPIRNFRLTADINLLVTETLYRGIITRIVDVIPSIQSGVPRRTWFTGFFIVAKSIN